MTLTAKYNGVCAACGRKIKVGTQIEWTRGEGARHAKCPTATTPSPAAAPAATAAAPSPTTDLIYLSGGSGYGCHGWKQGQIVIQVKKLRVLVVVSATKEYVAEDGLSFGVGEDRGYIFEAKARLATREEIGSVVEAAHVAALAELAEREMWTLREKIRQQGERPEKIDDFPAGEKIWERNPQNKIYGGGEKIIRAADCYWLLVGNGADGDDWGINNLPGTIAYRLAF